VSRILSLSEDRDGAIGVAAKAIGEGSLIVFPTDTVYGVGGDAFNQFATSRIFDVKARSRSMPLPVLVSRPRQAWALCAEVPKAAAELAAAFWPGGLTLILPVADGLSLDLGESKGRIAVRMPAQDDLIELISIVGPLAATSANLSGIATPGSVKEIRSQLGDGVAVYLDGGPAGADTPSTIVDVARWRPKVVREGAISKADIEKALGRD
jgi:tRNA threonylcarbamoyl adenosine modification protein (Sua5/YciO/YrdC/YwlC family)